MNNDTYSLIENNPKATEIYNALDKLREDNHTFGFNTYQLLENAEEISHLLNMYLKIKLKEIN